MRNIPQMLVSKKTSLVLLALTLLASMAIIGIGKTVSTPGSNYNLPDGFDSTTARAKIESLPAADTQPLLVLYRSNNPLSPPVLSKLATDTASTKTTNLLCPTTNNTSFTPCTSTSDIPIIPGKDGKSGLAIFAFPDLDAGAAGNAVIALRENLAHALPAGTTAQVTGPAAIRGDLANVFDGANTTLLISTVLIVAFLLIVTYRSPSLWLLPLIVIGLAEQVAAVAATRAATYFHIDFDASVAGILSVLVFGAGTDYSLLLISRYRDELRQNPDRRQALADAVKGTAESIISSSTTVVLGLLTLLLSAFPSTRALGLTAAIGVAIAALYALVALPLVLAQFGRWVFWPRRPELGQTQLTEAGGIWQKIGAVVARRPAILATGSLAILVIFAGNASNIPLGLNDAQKFLQQPESIAATKELSKNFDSGISAPVNITSTAPAGKVLATLKNNPDIVLARVVTTTPDFTQYSAVLSHDPDSVAAENDIKNLRTHLDQYGNTYVGGSTAERIDSKQAALHDAMLIFPLILALVLIVLAGMLRSLVAPVLLVATVVLTYATSMGLSWWIFQMVGMPAMDQSVPLFAFVFLVALGVDYNIFLVFRARQEASLHGTKRGILRALAATGGVITSAGVLLAAVFAVLGVLPLLVMAQLGVVVCIGVLIDTLLVRTIIVPALITKLGEKFWWPGKITRNSSPA